jgi:hypothetical protein
MTHLERRRRDVLVLQPCLELLLASDAPAAVQAPAIARMFEHFRTYAAPTWYATGTMTTMRPVDADGLRHVSDWASAPDDDWSYRTWQGTDAVSATPPGFEVTVDEDGSYLRLTWPADAPPDVLFAALEVSTTYPFLWGLGGFAFAWNSFHEDAVALSGMAQLLPRHPGMGNGDAAGAVMFLEEGFPHVQWLTLLGQALASRLSQDVSSLAAIPGIRAFSVGSALCVQAGDAPAPGDVNRGETLPAYRAVAAALAAGRSRSFYCDLPFDEDDDAEAWRARFG